MLLIIGYIVVCASVFGGYAMSGGHLAILFQPLELVMIGGAAVGALFVGNNNKSLKATMAALPLSSSPPTRYVGIQRTPGVVFNSYQPGVSHVVMRGIATSAGNVQGQATTGFCASSFVTSRCRRSLTSAEQLAVTEEHLTAIGAPV